MDNRNATEDYGRGVNVDAILLCVETSNEGAFRPGANSGHGVCVVEVWDHHTPFLERLSRNFQEKDGFSGEAIDSVRVRCFLTWGPGDEGIRWASHGKRRYRREGFLA